MTLSIGDGANDVAMIQEANIRCGLFGLFIALGKWERVDEINFAEILF